MRVSSAAFGASMASAALLAVGLPAVVQAQLSAATAYLEELPQPPASICVSNPTERERSTDTTHRTEGACSNAPPKRTRTRVEADVAIEEPRFGPFPGSPMDKRLKGKVEIPLGDPLIGETGMKKIEFDLSRQ